VRTLKDIGTVSDEILAEVKQAERVKLAEAAAVRAATPRYTSEISALMHKVAEDLRATSRDVSYADLGAYLEGKL
jgi:hypothetical protein